MKLYDVRWIGEEGEEHRFVRMTPDQEKNMGDFLYGLEADGVLVEFSVLPIIQPDSFQDVIKEWKDRLGTGKKQDWRPGQK